MSTVNSEFVEFIVSGHSPGAIIAFQPSAATKQRVAELLAKVKTVELTPEETAELDHFMHIEHIMRMAKAIAQQQLANP